MIIERIEWDGLDAPRIAAEVRSFGPTLSEVSGDVQRILRAVATRGDEGVREVAEHYGDDVPDEFRVEPEAIEAAPGMIDSGVREALETAAKNIVEVARAEMSAPGGAVIDMPDGQRIEIREDPVPRAGVYAPGGRAAYPSSVLMCAIPAMVAGVGRLAVVTPPGVGGRPNPVVLTACRILNLTEVYAIGGAQAIGALAFGTETVPRVDVIAGPGNRYVTAAKRIVAGRVGIDGVAGPSELAIVADGTADPWALALDLCAQAEHGEDSPLLIVSPDAGLLDLVEQNVIEIAASRPSVTEPALRSSNRPESRPRSTSSTPLPPSTCNSPSTASTRSRPARGWPGASSSEPAARPPSATTRPARITSCRPAAPPATAVRSGRAPSCGAPRSSQFPVPPRGPWRRRWTRSPAQRVCRCMENQRDTEQERPHESHC